MFALVVLTRGRDVIGRLVVPGEVRTVPPFQVAAWPQFGGSTDGAGGFTVRGVPFETTRIGARFEHEGTVYVGEVDVEPGVEHVEIVMAPARDPDDRE